MPNAMHSLGKAVQVEPMKSMLKAPGTKRLKLKKYELLSNFGFNCNLRRYTMVEFAGFHVNLHARAQEVLQCPRQGVR